jgi:hypothetical protein
VKFLKSDNPQEVRLASKNRLPYVGRLQEQLPGLNISRADAIRQLLAVGLKAEGERLDKID